MAEGQGIVSRVSANKGKGLATTAFGRGMKGNEDDRLFPFSMSISHAMWSNALEKAELEKRDPSTKRRTLHIHMLRKFFSSQLKLAIPEVIVEALIGHSGYLDEAYGRYTKEQIAEYYKKGETYLSISVRKEFTKIKTRFQAELDETKKKVGDHTLKLTVADLVATKLLVERDNAERRLRDIEEKHKVLSQRMDSWIKG